MYVIGRRLLGGGMLLLLALLVQAKFSLAGSGEARSLLDETAIAVNIVWTTMTMMYAALLVAYGNPQRWWAFGCLAVFAASMSATILRVGYGTLGIEQMEPAAAYLYTGILFALPTLALLDIFLPFRTEAPWKREKPA